MKLKKRIQSLESQLTRAESKTNDLDEVTERIIRADNLATSLPTTLERLAEAEKEISTFESNSKSDYKNICNIIEQIKKDNEFIEQNKIEISEILKKCDQALAASTSTGLARAFEARKCELQKIGWYWSGALIIALIAMVSAIVWRSEQLTSLMDKWASVDAVVLIANFLISFAVIGAPVWLAWLATKQIGYYFRLSEDYGFKAASAASYDGFKREAANQDEALERKVLESTLDRYDEAPLRFVDGRVNGSPVHELFASPDFREAFKTIPDFVKEVEQFTKDLLAKPKATKASENLKEGMNNLEK